MDVDGLFPPPPPPPAAALLDRAQRPQLLVGGVAEPDALHGRRLGLRRLQQNRIRFSRKAIGRFSLTISLASLADTRARPEQSKMSSDGSSVDIVAAEAVGE